MKKKKINRGWDGTLPELFETVGELAFVSVFADPLVLVGTAHFRLVPKYILIKGDVASQENVYFMYRSKLP